MKNLNLLFFVLLVLTTAQGRNLRIKIQDPTTTVGGQTYKLSCENAVGLVSYQIDGLPTNAELRGNEIYVSHDVKSGNYVVRIRAEDSQNRKIEQILTLTIVQTNNLENIEFEIAKKQVEVAEAVEERASRLGEILTSYSSVETLSTRTKKVYEGNKFPVEKFPTGGEPRLNLVPQKILSKQTIGTEQNRNEITVSDTKIRSASERHQNAVKGITNLLKLIDKARANRLAAQKNVQLYTEAYNGAIENQRNAQRIIIQVENRVQQIQSAIQGLQISIEKLRKELGDNAKEREAIQKEKINVLSELKTEESKKAKLLKKLQHANKKLADKVKKLADQLEDCQSLESDKLNLEEQLKKLQELFRQITNNRRLAENDVFSKKKRVKQLKKQLQKAESELSDAEVKFEKLKAEQDRLPRIIRELDKKIDRINRKFKQCENKSEEINYDIQTIKNEESSELANKIKDLQDGIIDIRKKLSIITTKLAAIIGPFEDLRNKLKKAEGDLVYLRQQVTVTQQDLRRVYIHGNEANTKVVHEKENLDAAIVRYQQQVKIISEATINLEKVRAEEALARLTLQEIIAEFSDALPYSIVPNGNGLTDIGIPAGNNAIGSGLGPFAVGSHSRYISDVGDQTDFNLFFSQEFGTNVNVQYGGKITTLSTVQSSRNGQLRGSGCIIQNEKIISGQIITSTLSSLQALSEQGQVFKVELNHCTTIRSNIKGHRPKVGDKVVVKGDQKDARVIGGIEVVCLS